MCGKLQVTSKEEEGEGDYANNKYSGKNYQQTKDTIYYKQLVPRLVGEMAKSFGMIIPPT